MKVALDGEIARGLTIGGLAFTTTVARAGDEQPVTLFQVPFSLTEDGDPLLIWGYLAGFLFIVSAAVRLRAEDAATRLRFFEALEGVPMVRLVRDDSPDGYWLEATSAVTAPPWSGPANIAAPIFAVNSAARALHQRFPDRVTSLPNAVVRMVEVPPYFRLPT